MSASDDAAHTIVVVDSDAAPAALDAWLRENEVVSHARIAPDAFDEVDRALRESDVACVVVTRTRDFLEALWRGDLTVERWTRCPRVLFLDLAGAADSAWLAALLHTWQAHQRRRQRQRAVAGLLLSAAAIACAFGLLWAAAG